VRILSDSIYFCKYRDYIASCGSPLLGPAVDTDELHHSVTVPYIDALLRNLKKRFGDMAKQVAVAARIFDPQRPPASTEDTLNALESLCSTFRVQMVNGTYLHHFLQSDHSPL